jgi:hypothetical protein
VRVPLLGKEGLGVVDNGDVNTINPLSPPLSKGENHFRSLQLLREWLVVVGMGVERYKRKNPRSRWNRRGGCAREVGGD